MYTLSVHKWPYNTGMQTADRNRAHYFGIRLQNITKNLNQMRRKGMMDASLGVYGGGETYPSWYSGVWEW